MASWSLLTHIKAYEMREHMHLWIPVAIEIMECKFISYTANFGWTQPAGSNLFRKNVPHQQSTAAMYECTSIRMHVNDLPACIPASFYWLIPFSFSKGTNNTRKKSPDQRCMSSFLLATDCNILVGQHPILTTVPRQNPVVVGDVVIYVVRRANNIAILLCAISINVERRSK
jgi:hypothetical protein